MLSTRKKYPSHHRVHTTAKGVTIAGDEDEEAESDVDKETPTAEDAQKALSEIRIERDECITVATERRLFTQ
ncbi:hypothetical protein HK102_011091 [Quaeritorhiza haematococci]|nr:hypothetical protein HK102_011091 [Quaeritorhiza haematococci]